MNDSELEGVIGHELGHVRNRDILVSSIAATVATAITFMARFAFFFGGGGSRDRNPMAGLLMLILAPIAALLVQMAVSRTREFGADAAAAQFTGSPDGLINGLRKLEQGVKRVPMDATPTHEHMFIVKPFSGRGMMKLFSTHPSTAERIARLEGLRGHITPSF
jgi:heat shock protein HtpX